jgi:hypothetical protein
MQIAGDKNQIETQSSCDLETEKVEETGWLRLLPNLAAPLERETDPSTAGKAGGTGHNPRKPRRIKALVGAGRTPSKTEGGAALGPKKPCLIKLFAGEEFRADLA